MAKAKKRGFIKYKSYLFVDKDPVIDAVRTAVSDSRQTYLEVEAGSGVKAATLRGWLTGNTRRPQFATVAAVTKHLGKRGISLDRGKVTLID